MINPKKLMLLGLGAIAAAACTPRKAVACYFEAYSNTEPVNGCLQTTTRGCWTNYDNIPSCPVGCIDMETKVSCPPPPPPSPFAIDGCTPNTPNTDYPNCTNY